MKAVIENGILWIGLESYEEVALADKWEKDNAKLLKPLQDVSKRNGTKITLASIMKKCKEYPDTGIKDIIFINNKIFKKLIKPYK